MLFFSPLANAEEEVSTAEIVGSIEGEIPRINVSKWTSIVIDIEDQFGLNWTYLKERFPYATMKLLWPLMFGRDVVKYLGYTSLQFVPEIYIGNPKGWELKIEPSTIAETTGGYKHKIILYAQVDALAVDYSVVVRINCTRFLANKERYGSTYIYIPLKVAAYNYIQMKAIDSKKFVSPRSIVDFRLEVTNKGFYEDVFKFEMIGENGIKGVFLQPALSLKPGEIKRLTMTVLTPEKFFDPGTSNYIHIYVSSISDPNKIYLGSVVVETTGFYFSQLTIMIIVLIVIVLIILIYLVKKLRITTIHKNREDRKKQKEEKYKK